MARPPSPHVRGLLIERAASMLARREPVTLRSLVAGTGVSTMAVYTYFGGMDGLWGAVRQEGFRRLAERLASVDGHRDPVRHLAALGVAYSAHGVAHPDLYRVMFDAGFDLPDPEEAAASLFLLGEAAGRAVEAGRFAPRTDPSEVALRTWASGHGLVSLAVSGVLSVDDLRRHAPVVVTAVCIEAGDAPARARRSVRAAWAAAGDVGL